MQYTSRFIPILGLMLAHTAAATPLWWAQSAIQSQVNNVFTTLDSGQVQQINVVSSGPIDLSGTTFLGGGGINGHYSTFITASAALGLLTGAANAAEDFTQYQVAPSSTSLAVRFFDTVTLNSASVPLGTFVDVTVTLVFTDDLIAGPTTCCANAQINGTGAFSPINYADQVGSGAAIAHSVTAPYHFLWAIGTQNPIGAFLSFDATSSPGCCNILSGSSAVNWAQAQFFIDTPAGVSADAASGKSYATSAASASAPEPAPGMLAGLGLVLTCAVRRKLFRFTQKEKA